MILTLFFTPMKKLSQSYVHMDSRSATFVYSPVMLLQGRVTIFWAHIFGGAGFLTVNLRRAKILEPLL